MHPHSFTAASAEEAVEQIRAKLGSDAVVLNVRPLPRNGLARLWQKPMIEVLAHRPDPPAPATPLVEPVSEALAQFRQQLDEIRQQVGSRSAPREIADAAAAFEIAPAQSFAAPVDLKNGNWRVGAALQRSGLLPLHAQQVLDELRARHGDQPPSALIEEIGLTRAVLAGFWRQPAPLAANSLHVLIGPGGSGKTTCLCKWLTQTVLVEGRLARVWRLDGATANMAESLSVYCDILGMPCERNWPARGEGPANSQPSLSPRGISRAGLAEDIGFIDLPGVDWRQPLAIKELAGLLKQLGSPQVHLVLNGAYDISILLAQVRAFAAAPVEDLVITHLDEETRWGKLWNLVLGTNYSIRHFSTGQNIPGDFCAGSPEMIFIRQFPHK